MPKKIYIIEAKLSSERVNYLNEILERRSKEYERVFACTIADYIVTALKSPSRIIRNVKKVIYLLSINCYDNINSI